ncbi:MAG: DNA gyrase subunit A [Bacteroides thetaiotaomicron]|jgi:DNA gyrase subunit A|uniref:DNA gyrase subunit A n=1 Tax=Bacteroides thetaiotaomicron TaxID=818 RepID=UPI0009081DCB|nr:DNA gyrase subunit A [Bacteroides thetaiotaomicron]MCA6026880.1 DNA gyrase subunit A [Bacteroides thetaiotaomicron]MCE8716894.1 DNA gyrase subunit A [Bacteroides thetaiotaomicron]MCS2838128.1 DNA gyrase subunit A [Bacteroides thetaiotaomicron]MCS2963063.1 DNA gyrase subunit A [Bacteroides thetaiotaomicron]MCS3228642.1 DNA gyrase subunit A [Bacteroides thetaiotaomicron]
MLEQDRIIKINIEEEMKSSYIDYSMSVIVSRALPDVRDGFKPVHRRILYGMMELGNTSDKPYKKSARIVGEVLGKYHPHGDFSVYYAMVRMAQEWAMRYPLVDGQGNFGSVDGDSPAAMRYTEARLNKLGEAMMDDLYKETVDFEPNFDNTLTEPKVMPTRIPNLLVNGASGIAVGMATNMPPHNLSEVIDACEAYIDNQEITVEELMTYVKAPDFPTGGYIYGISGVREGYLTGRGRVVMRAKAEIETGQTHDKIVVTEIPYNVNKAELIKYIADLVNDKRIEGISNANDESDRDGMRIVIDVKRDANASVVLNKLYKMTALQTSFGVNNVALVHGRPKTLNLRDMIKYFVEHRHEVVIRRTQFDLRKAKERAHILEGLIIASDNIDEVIRIIRAAKTPNDAIAGLIERFNLTEIQSRAIVEMRLRQLTGLMQDQLHAEYEEIMKQIAYLESILADDEVCRKVMKDELLEVKAKYGDERRSEIVYSSEEFNPEDFYADDQMIITISHMGYIKRTPLTEFRAQNRGGVGSKGTETRDADFVEHIYPATMHNTMMFFTQKGKCYWLKVYEIPEGTKNSKGRAIQNLLNIDSDDSVTAYLRVKSLDDTEYINSHYVLFCTKKGVIKKTLLEQYSRPRQNGVNAITIREDDSVIEVRMTNGNNEIIIANRNGRAIRFHEAAVRVMGRTATGVRGITLDNDGQDEVIGMICIKDLETESVMVVSEQGYGKRSEIEDYRKTNRGGKGVKTMNITEKTGKLVTIKSVTDENDLMIINKSGITIRLKVADVRIMGRATQGVRLINLEKRNDQIGSVCKVMTESLEDEVPAEEAEGTIVSDLTTDQDVDNADTATDVNENNNEIEE